MPWAALLALLACGEAPPQHGARPAVPRQSSTLVLDAEGATLVVVNPDSDSISVIDTAGRRLRREIALGPRPAPDAQGRYEPALGPRGVDLSADGKLAYVACQWSGEVLTVDVEAAAVRARFFAGAEPVSVLLNQRGDALYVAVYQSAEVLRVPLSAEGLPEPAAALRRRAADRPFGLALDGAGAVLYASRFLLQPGADRFDAGTLSPTGRLDLKHVPLAKSRLQPNGAPRGVYGVTIRPGRPGRPGAEDEIWLPHLLLSTEVAQPQLDFESTVFPAISVAKDLGPPATLSIKPQQPGLSGAFGDIVSGPRAVAFSPDGSLAMVLSMSSEDVLVLDAERRVGVDLVRPLPGDLPEGIVIAPDGRRAYVDERASGDVAVLAIAEAGARRVQVDGPPIARLHAGDPMPAELRLGQRLFYSANSAEFPMTRNFWVACASCHLEGRSDAVTWLFSQGPRDTPSNAGGTRGTGFLLHTAMRNSMLQYDETIRVEQGGDMDLRRPQDRERLQALGAYVDLAIPLPRSPEVDPATKMASAAAQRGRKVFEALGCTACHGGPRLTDSGQGNPELDLAGTVLVHDVGTCDNGRHPDQPTQAVDGSPRDRCKFDTPSLNGVFDSAPYFHNGSAETLEAVVDHFTRRYQQSPTPQDRADLVAYLRSL
jgi:YVTN family beta-propeller protein